VAATVPSAAPDLIALGRVWTGDAARPWAEGVAVRGDTIVAVGDGNDLLALAGRGTEVLRAAFVMPGFQDSHVHFLAGGFQLASVNLRDAASPAAFVERLAAHAGTVERGQWILGGDWDHELWPGAPLPERQWIDPVTPDHPVFVTRLDGHMALANSVALRAAGVDRHTADPPGGVIVRGADGDPTGVLKDAAMDLVRRVVPSPGAIAWDAALQRAMAHATRCGVTAIGHMNATNEEVEVFRRAHRRGDLTLRVAVYVAIAQWAAVAEEVRTRGPGDEWLRVAGVKGFVDGSLGSTTAWFDAPYDDAPHTVGLVVTPLDSLRRWMEEADAAGLQLAIHAIGDRANGWLLDALEQIVTMHGPRDRRPRVEHAQHLRRADIGRLGRLGVIAAMQPYHAIDDGRWVERRIGSERAKTTYAFRSLLDAGATLAFGSDWTVAPLDPLLGVYAAVTRRTIDGATPGGWIPAERITVEEALRAYTAANARALFYDRTGVLAPGRAADLVVLDRDVTAIPPETIPETRVLATVVGGRVVFRADGVGRECRPAGIL
jgi:predicted amidohydrolase YtcJ